MESIQDIWSRVLAIMQSQMSQTAYSIWIKDIQPQSIENGEFVVCVNTDWQRTTLLENYAPALREALQQVLGIPIGLKILARESQQATAPVQQALPIEGNGFPANVGEDEFTFDNFIVGNSNQFAYAASKAVADKPGLLYNPLFIYGNSGLGKTHLLCAICNEIRRQFPHYRILYTKGETMANELIEAIQNKTTAEFHAKYRQADVFLADDVQFLAGKERVQEEFFHTFESFHSAGKQIVLTSDRPPREIATLSERLRSRFETGLADIQPPDLETRIAIIRRKAQLLDLPLQDDVAGYIAGQLKSNVRQLEGVVKRMRAQYLLNNEQPNLIAAQNAIRDIRYNNQPTPITVERIIAEVARTMEVSPEDIRSNKRSAPISKARQVAAFVVRSITNLSMEAIGAEFGGRDHSSIVYAIQVVERIMKTDMSFKHMVNDIIKNISEG